MASFGSTSQGRLSECDDLIQIVCYDAIQVVDFSIITGHRGKAEQNAKYPKYSKVKWPNSKHNSFPSKAIDIAPYIKPYGAIYGNTQDIEKITQLRNVSKREANDFILKAYARTLGVIEAMAYRRGISIRLGMDWDMDYDLVDQTFHDLGHWELL